MKVFSLFLVSALCLFLFSFENPNPHPDPESFGKKLVATLKAGDTSTYKMAFMLDKKLANDLIEGIMKDSLAAQRIKDQFKKDRNRLIEKAISRVNRDLSEAIFIIEKWKKGENIQVNKLEYIRTYYEIEYGYDEELYVMDKANVIVKHENSYYMFYYGQLLWAKEKFVGGDLYNISTLDSNFRQSEPRYGFYDEGRYNLTMDSAAVEPADVVVDTVVTEEQPQTKKRNQEAKEN